jgi:8-hydroxy-5-deazaflavin:NADPH oxidoreductase
MNTTIGIIGSGSVGQSLANGFIKHGYEVMMGTNTPAKQKELQTKVDAGVRIGSFAEAAAFGRILVLAVKGGAAESALEAAGHGNLEGKTVLDATNPIADAPPVDGVLQYSTAPNTSLMERLQAAVPGARFVKAFSCIGAGLMVNPDFGGQTPTMFICGDSGQAKDEAKAILSRFGFEVEDMGTAVAARAIEPLAMLWCIPGFRENRWTHAFKLLKR